MTRAGLDINFLFDRDVSKSDLQYNPATNNVEYIAKGKQIRDGKRLTAVEQEVVDLKREREELRNEVSELREMQRLILAELRHMREKQTPEPPTALSRPQAQPKQKRTQRSR